jgi:putative NADPH-quinone reductase
MSKRILVINCHPDSDPARLCAGLAEAYGDGATASGHDVRRLDLASIRIPFLGSKDEFEQRPMPEALVPAAESIKWCEHLVLVMPLWLGTMPALAKSFLEQVMRPGFAFEYGSNGNVKALLLNRRSARIIVTMGMPAPIYRLWFLSHGIAGLRRSILNFVGFRPIRQTFVGLAAEGRAAKLTAQVERVRRLGELAK